MKIALFCMYVMLKEIFISFYEFVHAAQNIQPYIVLLVFLLLLVVYLLSSEMTTRVIDFLKNSIEHKECEQSTWRLEPVVFARSERKCVTLHPRESDHNIEDTKYAIENVLALMCSERMSTKFSLRRNWEVDFVRLDISLLMKNNLSILLLWTTTRCAVMNVLLQRRLERP